VARIFCKAGKRVNTTTHVRARADATHKPISRMGRIPETLRAANPMAAAAMEAVVAVNLFARVKIWCSSIGSSPGLSAKRDCM
jgi:hypothetical protein